MTEDPVRTLSERGAPARPQTAAAEAGNELWHIEQHGIDAIPDDERSGSARELFWVWLGGNVSLTYIIIGGAMVALGLGFWAAVAAIVLGNLLFVVVGLGGVAGPRAGTATMVVSRAAFGLRGNLVPTLLAWLTVVGWQAVFLVLSAFATFSLAGEVGIHTGTAVKLILLVALVLVTYGAAVLGHATILFLQKVFTYLLGAIMIGVAIQVALKGNVHYKPEGLAASTKLATFCLATMIVAALPLSLANYPSDYSRYLPRDTSARAIVGWTVLGNLIPAIAISIVGVLAAGVADLSDPVAGLKPLLASWYFVPFLIVVIGGSITNNFLNTYTSGLTLLALGVRLPRWKTIIIDAVIATGLSVYAIFFYDFTTAFTNFLSLTVAWLAPWCAIFLVDGMLRRFRYRTEDLLASRDGQYWFAGGVNRAGAASFLLGALATFFTTNATKWQSPISTDLLGGADLSIPVGMLVAGGMYFVLQRRSPAMLPDREPVAVGQSA
ncbi:MAG: nucleobase:cation symporter, family [Solirubrobacteraceae bacterium]|jgi:NCS1 nucleoside transporter family|nr:nucleobase:cation symporter, family [Solirubrobacteraceae bacterium]